MRAERSYMEGRWRRRKQKETRKRERCENLRVGEKENREWRKRRT